MIYRAARPSRPQTFCCLLIVALVAALCPAAWADPTAPGSSDRQITLAVATLVNREHVSRHPLDKEISERCLTTFLKELDPMKVYFYQSDVDEFTRQKDVLCESIRRGDIRFAYQVFHTLLQRVDERVRTVDALLASPLDFTTYEQMVKDSKLAVYPRTPAEAQDRWRQRIKYDLLVLKTSEKAEKKEGKEARDKLTRRYHSYARRMHQMSSDELLELYLNAFTTAFDPHTDYMSPDTQKNFEIAMGLNLEGIGASLMSEDGYTVVKKIIPGGAADKDGRLKLEDKIVAVGQGDDGEMADIVDMKIGDVVKLIRGKPATFVRLEVIPASGKRQIYRIAREKIELKDSEAQGKVFDVGRRPDGAPYRIGVIKLPSFYRDMAGERNHVADFRSTTRDVRVILDDFNRRGVDAVALDLRENGGGALNEAISLTGLFIKDGPVVQVKDADGFVKPYYDPDSDIAWSGPLVVMISKFSASASEILAGAIQDYGRGLIIGDHATHGKGTVQELKDVGSLLLGVFNGPSLGALKITTQKFYRPDGDSTQKRGVLADIELPSLTTHLEGIGEADLDYALAFDKIDPARFQRFDDVDPGVCDQLRKLSQQRVMASEKFQKTLRNIARYKEYKAKKYQTLNEEQFVKERAELNADKEEEHVLEKHSGLNNAGIERDYYLDEVLAITADYVTLENAVKARQEALGASR
ncbi:MAG: carboxy terminal-processing peptidase [Planctomycetaceae bacterium]|nr:carboxy terminal-processing peptidase [Planctomycetaceae bacterium]